MEEKQVREKQLIEENNSIRMQLVTSIYGLQIISYYILANVLVVFIFPITIWGLILAIPALLFYSYRINYKLRQKIKKEEATINE